MALRAVQGGKGRIRTGVRSSSGGKPGVLIGFIAGVGNLQAYKTNALKGAIPAHGTLTGALTANVPTRALVGNIPGQATFTANLTSGAGSSSRVLLANGSSFLLQTDGTSKVLEAASAPSTNRVLLSDGTSFLLQSDGSSKVLEASGASTANLLLLADGVSHLLFTDGVSRLQLAA